MLTEKPDPAPLIDNYCADVVEARCDGTVQCSKYKGHSSFLPQAFVEENAVIWFVQFSETFVQPMQHLLYITVLPEACAANMTMKAQKNLFR